ncbi:MAG: 2,3,4,5-tetrahydropyridine-2,6-dicarboxylate N-succinyltransferase [Alphaproteobacteria bacterium]
MEKVVNFQQQIEHLWEAKEDNDLLQDGETLGVLLPFLEALDAGKVRVVEKIQGVWVVHEWVKKGILLLFRSLPNQLTGGAFPGYDKIPLKCQGWDEAQFQQAGFRMTPGSVMRKGAFISPGAVIMPSFLNIGASVGKGTMIDSNVRVGSCAQIGANCHISDGVGIGGVLEPLQASPVIIEDNCFVGARCQLVEGVHLEEGCVLGMGVTLGASTKIINRETGEITYGRVPAYAVVVPGTVALPSTTPSLSLNCAILIKTVDAKTRSKTGINALLRS